MRRSILVALGWALVPLGVAAAPADLPPPRADLARRAEAIADAVLARQIAPPARQQMFLDGLKAVHLAAGVPHPTDLARRVSSVATPDQLSALFVEAWPRSSKVDLNPDLLEDALLRGMLSGITGASLLSAKEQRVAEQMEGNLYVGIQIAIGYDEAEKRPVLAQVLEGGPADRAGAGVDDRIEEIDGVSTLGVPLKEVVDRLRGAEGTDVAVRLRGKGAGEARTLTMTRGRLPRATVMGVRKRPDGSWTYRVDGPDAIGYVKLDSISGSTPRELRQVAPRLEAEGVRALILDLRAVNQFALHPTVLLADALLDGGTIGRVRSGDSVEVYEAEPDALFRDLPLAVIVDPSTRGEAAWLCAALQDNHRSVVVGTPTGADTEVQSTVPLPGGEWSLRLTTGRLERGDGRSLASPTLGRMETRRFILSEPFNARSGLFGDTGGIVPTSSSRTSAGASTARMSRRRETPSSIGSRRRPSNAWPGTSSRPGPDPPDDLVARAGDMARTGQIGAFVAGFLLLLAWAGPHVGGGLRSAEPAAARSRHPISLAFSPDGSRLFVANRDSGSLSVVDPEGARVVSEHDVGRALADLAVLPDGRHLLAVDRGADALLLLSCLGGSVRVVGHLALGVDPVRLLAWDDGSRCAIASSGTRRVTLVELARGDRDDPPAMRISHTLDLPFAPREMAPVRDGSRLVVADGFGGKLAVIDPASGTVESIRTLPAHNIRGLALSPDGRMLAVAHQTLHRLARSSFEDIHWGSLVGNHLRFLRVDALTSGGTDADLLRGSLLRDLGGPGNAAGDPAGLAFGRSGDLLVALGGVGEVASGREPWSDLRRTTVGGGPSAVRIDPKGEAGYVADGFDDTISVVDLATGERVRTIPLGDRPRPTPVAKGERLFRDARLSHDGWTSCHSCHTDGHTNGLLADTQGDGSFGTPKRVPSLRGVSATGPWNWTGSSTRLEDQVRKSIETTMRGPSPSDDQVEALVAYLGSLATARPAAPAAPAEAIERGREVFLARRCDECHTPPRYTSAGSYDVGLADEAGRRKFNPPSLLEIGLRATFFHDGRARSLEEVFVKFRHPRDAATSAEEAADLAAFLRSL